MSLFLTTTGSTITAQLGTSTTLHVQASYADNATGSANVTPGYQNTVISTTGLITIVAAPAASTARSVTLTAKNVSGSSSTLTINHTDGTTIVTVYSATLGVGESAQLTFSGWSTLDSNGEQNIVQGSLPPTAAYQQVRTVSSGTTDAGPTNMSAGNCLVLWNSATVGAKTQTSPTSAGTNNRFTIIDVAQTAGTNNITFTPSTGSVTGLNKVYTNGGAQTWVDTSLGWIAEV